MDDFIRRIPLVGAGFLLAVLWFDLMFDTLVSGEPAGVLSEEVLSSIAAYYQRAVVDSHPMGSFVGGAMFLTLLTPSSTYTLRRELRVLAYQALVDRGLTT
jgi:hypothetical protein